MPIDQKRRPGRTSAAGLVQELEKLKAKFNVTHCDCNNDERCQIQFVKQTANDDTYQKGFVIGVDRETCKVCFVVQVTEGTEEYYQMCENSVKPGGCDHPDALNRFVNICRNAECCAECCNKE